MACDGCHDYGQTGRGAGLHARAHAHGRSTPSPGRGGRSATFRKCTRQRPDDLLIESFDQGAEKPVDVGQGGMEVWGHAHRVATQADVDPTLRE